MSQETKQKAQEEKPEVEPLLPDGMTVDQLRQEILERYPGTTIEELEALGF